MPGFVAEVAFGGGSVEFQLRFRPRVLFARIEKRHVLAGNLVCVVAVNASRT